MLGLRKCLDHPKVVSTFVGISSETEVIAACDALDWIPPPELLREVQIILGPVHNLIWRSGLEENQDVPSERRRDKQCFAMPVILWRCNVVDYVHEWAESVRQVKPKNSQIEIFESA